MVVFLLSHSISIETYFEILTIEAKLQAAATTYPTFCSKKKFFEMAKQGVFSVLQELGCSIDEAGEIKFANAFFSDRLRDSFGAFAFNGRVATCRMIPIAECDNYGKSDPTFYHDMQKAKQAVIRGEGVVIVVSAIIGDDAYTHLTYISFESPLQVKAGSAS